MFIHLLALTVFATTPVSQLTEKVQTAWDATKSYKAAFKQTVFSKRLGTNEISTGTIEVSRPGKIRWDSPSNRLLQILNGKKMWHIHTPKRRKAKTVEIYEDISKQTDTRSLSFLSGKGEFKKGYRVELIKETPKSVNLKLTPIDVPGGESYIAEFDKNSYVLTSLVMETSDSRVRLEFSDIKTNEDLPDERFEYKPSKEDVVTVTK